VDQLTSSISNMPLPSSLERLDRLRKPLVWRAIVLVGIFCALLVGLNIWSLVALREGELNDTAQSTANMARALASHAERSMKVGDGILSELVDRAEHDGRDIDVLVHQHARLKDIIASTPEIQEAFVYDADGTRLVTSLPNLMAGSNADREFFRYHLTHTEQATHIGMPIRSRSTGILTIPLSRRVNRPDGSFAGVVMVSLNLNYFGRFYDSFDVGQSGTIVLTINDGTLLYRRPFSQAIVGSNVSNNVVFRYARTHGPVGTAMLVATVDGVERLYSYRHLDGYPLLLFIARSKQEILSDWVHTAIKSSLIVLSAVMILIWGARRIINQIIVREALEDELRRARAVTESRNVSLQELANTDGLTGLVNRRHFEEKLVHEQERARRTSKPCSLVLMDVDYFKKYNDYYGHVAGDTCLRQVASAISVCVKRPADVVARYGGEEFVVLLPDTDLAGACNVAEQIRTRIAALEVPHVKSQFGHVTVSLGVYTAHPGTDGDSTADWVRAADTLLYKAKEAGRNTLAAHKDGVPAAARSDYPKNP
jgi:diguanylate cyclase (GGDEF)-like protein